jgi:putative nucleotidyltransferase with HDIG domain
MSRRAWAYIAGILFIGALLSAGAFSVPLSSPPPWHTCAALTLLATLASLWKADSPKNMTFKPSTVFFCASVFLLPPPLFVIVILVAHAVEWAKERWMGTPYLRAWYLQPFNVAKSITAGFSAYAALGLVTRVTDTASVTSLLASVAAAALAYVAVDQIILGLALSLARGISWRESGVLADALLVEFPMASLGYVFVMYWQRSPWLTLLLLAPLVLIYRSLTIPKLQWEHLQRLERVNQDLAQASQAINQLNDELFLTLARVFDARDPFVGGHAAQVATYAAAIATDLDLPEDQVKIIRQAGYLHDIGKIAVPESILHKPGKLTAEEYAIVKTHVSVGAEIIEASQGLRHLAPFVRYHHECWDGRGYPEGLRGNEIPLEARILNICDSVEAMAADRPYRKGMSVEEIIAEVRRCQGTQFDPTIVEVFIRIIEREGHQFVVNSAREVERKQNAPGTPTILGVGSSFTPAYQPAE